MGTIRSGPGNYRIIEDYDIPVNRPSNPPQGMIRLFIDPATGKLAAIDSNGNNALPSGGGSPAGASGTLQYNNAGAFGGVAESTYVPGSHLLVIADPNLGFEVLSGPAEQNGIIVSNAEVMIQAGETGSGVQLNADSDITLSSNNGEFSLSSAGGGVTVSNSGTVILDSTPGKFQFTDIPVFANNAAAIAGGLSAGMLYRTGANPDPVCIVH